MKCSVVLPVWNGARTIARAVQSILNQDEPDFELIILDDGSKDSSPQIIREFAEKDPRIRAVFHESNRGLRTILNDGMEMARSEIIVRMDGDDEALPGRLRLQLEFLRAHPKVAVLGGAVYHMGRTPAHDRLVRLPETHQEIMALLPRENCMYHPSIAMRRRQILALGGYRREFLGAEDYDLWLRASREYQLANLREPVLRYAFSTGGESLGRKWNQFYYSLLASISYRYPHVPLADLAPDVYLEMARTGKAAFLEDVARGAITELCRLRMGRDALELARRYAGQMDHQRRRRIWLHLGRMWTRHVLLGSAG